LFHINRESVKINQFIFPTFLFLFAFLCRIFFFLQLRNYPLLDYLGSDPRFYYQKALTLLESGNWIGDKIFFASPFYQYFLALLFSLFGIDLLPVRIIQFLLGSFIAVLIYFIGDRCFDQRTGVLAGLIYCFYWLFPFYELTLEYDCVLLFCLVLAIALAVNFWETWRLHRCILLGLVVALSFTMRPNILIFLIPFWLFLTGRENHLPFSKILLSVLLFIFGFTLFIFPITLRNYLVGKELVLISAHGGEAFYTGNNPYTDGSIAKLPWVEIHFAGEERDFLKAAAQETGKEGYRAASAFWYRKGVEFIRKNPRAALKLYLKKMHYLIKNYEIPDNNDYQFAKTYFHPFVRVLSRIDFGLILALAVYGLMVGLRLRRESLFLYLYLLFTLPMLLLFPMISRYRLVIVPVLILFAGFALRRLSEGFDMGKGKRVVLFLPLFLSVNFLSNWNVHEEARFAHSYLYLGRVMSKQGKGDEAIRYYQKALSAFPTYSEIHASLAFEYQKRGDRDEAMTHYKKVLQFNSNHAASLNNLALLEYERGNFFVALGFAQRAVRQNPVSLREQVVKAKIIKAMGKKEKAVRLLEKNLQVAKETRNQRYLNYISALLKDWRG